jgi:hypothetical protein
MFSHILSQVITPKGLHMHVLQTSSHTMIGRMFYTHAGMYMPEQGISGKRNFQG